MDRLQLGWLLGILVEFDCRNLPGNSAFGEQAGNNTLILFIKPNAQNCILITHQNITCAITGLVLVLIEGKGFAGEVVLQLIGENIDYITAGIVAKCGRA